MIDDRPMRVLSAASVTTLHRTFLRHTHLSITLACKYRLYIRRNSTFAMPEQTRQQHAIEVPSGFTLHSENTTHILLPSDNCAFLNPVQEFNRDLSVACIRVWSEEWNRAKEAKWRATQEKRAKRPGKKLKGMINDWVPRDTTSDRVCGCCDRFEQLRGID
jgi:hypothetical protein